MLSTLNRHLARPLQARREGSRHLHYLRLLEQRQFDPPEFIRARQLEAVRSITRHAWETAPYYRQAWTRAGVHPEQVRSLEDLASFPLLTKAEIRTKGHLLRSELYANQPLHSKTTSGSTGVPLTVLVDADAMSWKRACTIRSDQWSGWRLGQSVARLWGHGQAERGGWKTRLRRTLLERERYLNTLNLNQSDLRTFADSLRRRPPGLLFGHAYSLYLLASFVRRYCPGQIRPRGIVSAAMVLHDWQRAVIEQAFETRVTNRYGCEETSLIASECEYHQGFHLNADGLYAEIIPDAQRNAGRLILTDLRNRAMPLIRYEVGDIVIAGSRTCPCGRGLPVLENVLGRDADFVLTPGGTLISGISLTDHFATEIRGATQVQILQEQLTLLKLRMVPGEGFGPESHRQIENLVRATFGLQMRYEVELVDSIAPEPSGKYRFCISPVANEHLKSLAT